MSILATVVGHLQARSSSYEHTADSLAVLETAVKKLLSTQAAYHGNRLRLLQESLGIPHSEETLAMLVNVHIVGGSKDLAQHVKGLTLRISVMQRFRKLFLDKKHHRHTWAKTINKL